MLLYCSPTDQYCVDMVGRNDLKEIINAMKHIEHILNTCKTKEDAVRLFPLTIDNFRWKGSEGSIDFAKKLWEDCLQ